jgi:hypothetical protein
VVKFRALRGEGVGGGMVVVKPSLDLGVEKWDSEEDGEFVYEKIEQSLVK